MQISSATIVICDMAIYSRVNGVLRKMTLVLVKRWLSLLEKVEFQMFVVGVRNENDLENQS
jgi:hypothetical protein